METFVSVLGHPEAPQRVRTAGRVLTEVMPSLSRPLCTRVQELPEVQGAVMWIGPQASDYRALSSLYATPQLCVVVYGVLAGESAPAQALAQRYQESGAGELSNMDGAYAVLVVDRQQRRAHVHTDAVGVRSLHYAQVDGALLLSPQLLGLVATGWLDLNWDLTSAASIVGLDWSIGRRSLLQGVRLSQPDQRMAWDVRGGLEVTTVSPFDFQDRIGAGDRRRARAQCDRVVDRMAEVTRQFAAGQQRIRLPLTDGLDSRVVLALFEGVGAHDKLIAATSGVADSPDVLGARAVAAAVGVPHERREPTTVDSGEFLEHASLLAFLDSGDSNAKTGLSALPSYRASAAVVSGNGGEIYRGNYYPVFGLLGQVPGSPERCARYFIQRLRSGRFKLIDGPDGRHRAAVEARLGQTLQRYCDLGARDADLADLLYLWERHGHWGARSFRRPWSLGWSPFASPLVIRDFYRLAPPLGKHNDVHARAIRRYLPLALYLRPFNRTGVVPLQGAGQGLFLLRQVELAQRLAFKKVSLKLQRGTEMLQLEQVWARLFANEVFAPVEALLTERDALSAEAFGPNTVRQLLERHRSAHDVLDVLGFMVNVELIRQQAQRAQHLARRLHAGESVAQD